jgi:chorismate lyase
MRICLPDFAIYRMLRRLNSPIDRLIMPSSPLRHRICPPAPSWSNRYECTTTGMPRVWRNWLLDQSSLTRRLQEMAPGQFSVCKLAHGFSKATAMECHDLGLPWGQSVWFREVELQLAGVTLVEARTVVPLQSHTIRLQGLARLGNRSLGSFLFSQPSLKRTRVRLYRCQGKDNQGKVWARRSVFTILGQPLQVTEVFHSHSTQFRQWLRPAHRIHSTRFNATMRR